jgi:beta-1,2-mannosidase
MALWLAPALCAAQTQPGWVLGPFVKQDSANPCLEPLATSTFRCPVRQTLVHWEEKDVYNPAAVVRNGQVWLLYRAEDTVRAVGGTSRLGIATSRDGLHFTRRPNPVFYPDNDAQKIYEWEGGCEDPRIVEMANPRSQRRYVLTYTAYDGQTARLMVATSPDLVRWQKHGPAFATAGEKYRQMWSKSGSIVCRRIGERLVATRINGQYWMYWGDTNLFVATSPDLIHWTPVAIQPNARAADSTALTPDHRAHARLQAVLTPRRGHFDSDLVEPGPPALLTKQGILLIYNSRNIPAIGDSALPEGTYAAGQALFSPTDPTKLLDRTAQYFIKPEQSYELRGQINNVCFVEGLVPFRGRWLLYYGTADSRIAVAACPAPD